MKIRHTTNSVAVCKPNGEPIVVAYGKTTLEASKKLRKLLEALENDEHWPGNKK